MQVVVRVCGTHHHGWCPHQPGCRRVERCIVANTAHVEAWKVTNGAHPELLQIVEETLDWLGAQTDLTIVEAQMTPFKELIPRIRAFAQARGVRAVFIDTPLLSTGSTGQVPH